MITELKATIQKSNDKVWYDESGNPVQVSRLTKTEKLMERTTASILKEAISLHNSLAELKTRIMNACEQVREQYYSERGLTPDGRGNFTFYNFNRTIKIEVNINDTIEFDELGVKAAKQLFDEFLGENISTTNDVIRELVMDAFSTRSGKLDSKKLVNLIRYRSRINNDKFTKAVDLLEQSIRKPGSRMYFRIWQREIGQPWQNVDLNFSSINIL